MFGNWEFGQKDSLDDAGNSRIAGPEEMSKGLLPADIKFRHESRFKIWLLEKFINLIRRRNLKAFKAKLKVWYEDIKQGRLDTAKLSRKIKGWIEYARQADSYKLRKALFAVSRNT